MNQPPRPPREKWTSLAGMPQGAEKWGSEQYAMYAKRWEVAKRKLTEKGTDRSSLNRLLDEQSRAFAIETGQIEGLYTIKEGITEQLIVEGFEGVISMHSDEELTEEAMSAEELQGLLEDQLSAIEMTFSLIKKERELHHSTVREFHALLTRNQKKVMGRLPDGSLGMVDFPQREKGAYKLWPNNPREESGEIFEYCPPEQCESEMGRLFDLYRGVYERKYPVGVESAWLHYQFVRTHPFRDGNGRMARLLMAYAYLRRGLPPPLIDKNERRNYIGALRQADFGDLRPFAEFLQRRATNALEALVDRAEKILNEVAPSPQKNSPLP